MGIYTICSQVKRRLTPDNLQEVESDKDKEVVLGKPATKLLPINAVKK